MAKSSSIWIDQLVSLLGLDKETVKDQIIPFLDSFDHEASLRTHLQGLVGMDTPLAKSFVRDFTRSRFPQQSPFASASTTPTLVAAPTSSAASAHSSVQKKRGKKTLAERARIGQTLAPRKLDDARLGEEEQMAKLAEAFGGIGTVYRKKQEDGEFFAGTGKGKKGKQPGSKSGPSLESNTLRQHSQPESEATNDFHPAVSEKPACLGSEDQLPPTSQAKSQPSPPPTAEMLAIDAVVEELTSASLSASSSSSDINRKMCFCQGRRHALAPYAPLCYSCGLILCAAIQPSSLSPLSSCPSCSATPLLGAAARSDLVAKLTAERQILFEQQLLQIAVQREQKRLNKAIARDAREEEAALFSKLGIEPVAYAASSVSHAGPVVGKHGALQKARVIAGDAQRTAKVLSLDMKTHKVKSHTKVTRPKAPADAVKEKPTLVDAEKHGEKQDPFVGLDGSALVKNETDDGLRPLSNRAAEGPKREKGSQSIPPRTWSFAGRQLLLRPTALVQ